MSRMTQYIGLTLEAQRFVRELERVESDNKTSGMFDEGVPLGVWKDFEGNEYKEVIQCAPWSSGLMILTRLVCNDELLYSWILDSTADGIDNRTGRFYI